MTLTGAIPTYLVPTRNHLGIIGPVHPSSLNPASIKKAITDNALMANEPSKEPVFAVLTNSTYDGLCYNVQRVQGLLGQSVDRMLFDEAWFGYARFNPIYRDRFSMRGDVMLDPIKVSVVTLGVSSEHGTGFDVPAGLVTAYLDQQGIIPEKTADYTILFLFSLGVTKGKWGTLINALLDFKRDYDSNAPLSRVLPALAKDHPARYGKLGLKDLSDEMWGQMQKLGVTDLLERAFGILPEPVFTPVQAYEQLVLGNVEQLPLDEMVGAFLQSASSRTRLAFLCSCQEKPPEVSTSRRYHI
jgi:arginine/lysine/ornithine decarboxylase